MRRPVGQHLVNSGHAPASFRQAGKIVPGRAVNFVNFRAVNFVSIGFHD